MDWRPQGDHIGWLNGDEIYLQADSAYAVVQRMARDEGDNLPVTLSTLKKRLNERGMLASTEKYKTKGRDVERLEIRKVLQGKRRVVLHLNPTSWADPSTGSEPSEPFEPRPAKVNTDREGNDSSTGSQTGDQVADSSHGSEPFDGVVVPGEGSDGTHGSQNKLNNLPPAANPSRSTRWEGEL